MIINNIIACSPSGNSLDNQQYNIWRYPLLHKAVFKKIDRQDRESSITGW